MRHKQPALAIDAVLFDRHERLLLIRREFPPFKRMPCPARLGMGQLRAADDAASAEFVADCRKKKLAFGREKIVADARRLLGKS